MAVSNFWPSKITVHPRRPRNAAPQYARGGDETCDGAVRLLSHKGARNIVSRVVVDAGRPCEIQCGVPRLSDDHIADCERTEAFITAVFWGEPTEGP